MHWMVFVVLMFAILVAGGVASSFAQAKKTLAMAEYERAKKDTVLHRPRAVDG